MNCKDFICRAPFEDFMVFEKETWFCCPDWMDLPKVEQIESFSDLESVWFGDLNTKIRESILDGSYKYCSKERCPHLSKLVNSNKTELELSHKSKYTQTEYFDLFYKRKKFFELYKDTQDLRYFPKLIYFNFDRSCNLRCPSCRLDLVPNEKNNRVTDIIKSINEQFSTQVEMLHITGSGDPFYSNAFREYLQTFNPKLYPKLKSMFLSTNGIMWTKKMWESMKSIHPYVGACEISIDAATKDTYETKTRLGGNWDKLINNLKYISTIKTIRNITLSFVVQDSNVHEIVKFKNLVNDLFKDTKNNYLIMYRSIQDWNHQSEKWMEEQSVHIPTHPKHSILLEQLNEVGRDKNIQHNMWHLVPRIKSII